LFHLGELSGSLHHITEAIRTQVGVSEPVLAMFAGYDVGVFCRSYLAHLRWHHDDDDRAAVACAAEAIDEARRTRHPFSQAIALNYAAMLHVFRRESNAALEHGLEAVELCQRHGFAYYLAMANVLTGWVRSEEGDVSGGLAQIRNGLERMRSLQAELRLPFYLLLLAEALARAGLVSEALANLSTAFAYASKNGEEWMVAELHRGQGELLAAQGKTEVAGASFRRGLEAARRSGSLALQRRLEGLTASFPEGTPIVSATERS
jgi:predicted ATPase